MSDIYQPEEDSYLMSLILKTEIPKFLEENKDIKFIEVGCGSGIQLQTALNSGIKRENIFSCDINEEAVKHCRNLGFNSQISNLFSKIKGKYEIIVFNPPYLPEDKKEPASSKIATTGGKKGGELINKFLKQAKKHLTEGGRIFLLTSSLTDKIDFLDYNKKIIADKKLFFESLFVWELSFVG